MFADFNNNQNNDDFLDEFRQKLNSESSESYEERKIEISRSKNVFIGTVSGIALAAVVGWFVLSPKYSNNASVELPVIRRPQTAIKVQPSEPGGMEIPNQDKSVYDIIEKKDNSQAKVENLLPPPEEPQMPVVSASNEIETSVAEKAQEIIMAEELKTEVAQPAENPTENIVQEKSEAPKEQPKENTVVQEASPQPVVVQEKNIAETTETVPQKVEEKSFAVTQEQTAPKIEPKPIQANGPWQVQLISSPNRQAVDNAWAGLVKKYPMLKGQAQEIETADLGAKGTYYRLKAGGFANRSGADRLCNDIKALGGTCIVKKK